MGGSWGIVEDANGPVWGKRGDGGRSHTAYASGMIAVNVGTLLTYIDILPSGYDIHSLPWKITMLVIGKPSISMGHLYHGYVK